MEAVCRRIVRVRHRGVRLGVVILRVRMEGEPFSLLCGGVIEADSNVVEREVTVGPTAAAAAANPPPTPAPSSAVS